MKFGDNQLEISAFFCSSILSVCVCVCVCVRVCVVGGKMNENAQMILHWHYFSQF